MSRALRWLPALVGLMILAWVFSAAAGPPGMDPKRASGIPRVDPQVAPGTVTVRCLLGGFDQPAADVVVTLELTSADGQSKQSREAPVAAAGRATFEGLEAFVGGTAIASVDFDGEVVRSQPIPLDARAGSRVMLVKGASGPPTVTPAASPAGTPGAHGGAQVPLPGQPFPLEGRPVGTIIAGALDLEKGVAMEGVVITLRADPPGEAEPILRESTTSADGRVVFEGLLPPEFPTGTKFTVEAVVGPGQEVQRSAEFEFGEEAVAVVLAHGRMDASPGATPTPTQARRPAMPPRTDASVAPGTVKVALIDANDAPVSGQQVQVVKKDMTGTDVSYTAQTGADGVALVEGIDVRSDAFYFAGTVFDGGPYQSTFFQLPDTTGASVELRVFPTTADASRVRSGVHYEVRPLENDAVQIIRVFEVLVEGAEAYWPPGGMRLYGPPGSRFVKVLPRSTRWLEEREGSPFAVLTGPVPPGEVVELSTAYVLDHDGSVSITWKAPFPVVQVGVALEHGLDLVRGAQGPPEQPPHQTGQPMRLWKMTPAAFIEGPCSIAQRSDPDFRCPPLLGSMGGTPIELEVAGLPTRPALYRTLALGVGGVIVLFMLTAIVLRPRVGQRQALVQRRDLLMSALRDLPEDAVAERDQVLRRLDRVYRQLDAVTPSGGAGSESEPAK